MLRKVVGPPDSQKNLFHVHWEFKSCLHLQVCVVGPNGAGKSTLMNLIAGDLEPTEGYARRSNKLRVGRYAQHFVDALSMEDTPVEYLMRTYGHIRKPDDTELKEYDVRAMLGKFGLAGHHHHQARLLAALLSIDISHAARS